MREKTICALLIMLCFFFCSSFAMGASLFGPRKYVRSTEGPTEFTDTFRATEGDARLLIENGEWDGNRRVDNQLSSARIFFNGIQIYGPSDFNQNVHVLQTRISLQPENTITVELSGSPDSYLTLQITRPSVTLTANPEIILPGDSSLLDWNATDAATCAILPNIGAVTVNGAVFVTPEAITTYTITATDPIGLTATASREIRVNHPPVAASQTVARDEDTSFPITLSGWDADHDPLTLQVTSGPTHGTLRGTAPDLTYTPSANYNGADFFSFKANDGMVDSAPAMVFIAIAPVNDAPVANAGPDQAVFRGDLVTLNGSGSTDVDGDALTYHWSFASKPSGSTATFSNSSIVNPAFTPDIAGVYEIALMVNDGTVDSAANTVQITANPRMVAVPDVAGLTQTEAEAKINAADLAVGNITFSYSDTVPEGQIASQVPAAGSSVKEGTAVDLVISRGPSTPPPEVSINTNPQSIQLGASTTLNWTSTNANTCVITPDIGTVSGNGATTVTPVTTTTYIITATGPGGMTSASVTVNVLNPAERPTVTVTSTPTNINRGDSTTLSWSSTYSDSVSIDNGIGQVAVEGSVTVSPEHTTTYTISVAGPNGAASEQATVLVAGHPEPLPEGSFGKQYEDLIPTDSTVTSYDAKRFSLITGKVQDVGGQSISGVSITIHDHPEYGTASTDNNGKFTIPVEGGGTMKVVYRKEGLLTSHRQVYVPWNDFVVADPVQMIPQDPASTTFSFDGNPATVATHVSTKVTDASGSRSATVVLTGDNSAYLVDENGHYVQPLSTITVRATEFTTPASMPAKLPPNSAYTYCIELSVDGAARVRFAKPVTVWIDNFLGFNVGEIVPVGYYDRDKGVWVPADNGKVVRLLDTDHDGVVDALDSNGDGLPDDLNNDGSYSDEVTGLGDPSRYAPGATFWRVSVTHFTPWDCNWPYGPPPDATPPNPTALPSANQQDPKAPKANDCNGSYVERRSRVVNEDIPIPGTGMYLHYSSNRTKGYKQTISVPASGATVPASLKKIIVQMTVAGRSFEQVLDPLPMQWAEFEWDGLDSLGRPVGPTMARVRIGFEYDLVYYSASSAFSQAFAQAGTNITAARGRQDMITWKDYDIIVKKTQQVRGPSTFGDGWTLSSHHSEKGSILFKGDGSIVDNTALRIITTVAGNGHWGYSGDNGPAVDAALWYPSGVTVDASGDIFIADFDNNRIRKVTPDGIITTVAGNGSRGSSGDYGPAIHAQLYHPSGVAVDARGNIFIADSYNNRIRKVTPDGIITTVAGNYTYGYSGDNGPAVHAQLNDPSGVAVDANGNIYIADNHNYRIRKVSPDGIITTVAGNGSRGSSGDNGPAVNAQLYYPTGVAVDGSGNIYIADAFNNRIRKVAPDGIITTVAGNTYGYSGDNGPAIHAQLNDPRGVAVDGKGNIYIADVDNHRVRKVTPDGIITTVAGNGIGGSYSGDNGPAVEAQLDPFGVTVDASGNIYIADFENNRIREISYPDQSSLEAGDSFYTEKGVGYVISNIGLHTKTIDLDTGVVLLSFGYNAENNLSSVTDQFVNLTVIQRDQNGVPTAIVSPDGLTTSLTIDTNNHLSRVTYPDGANYNFEYTPDGLLTAETEPNGNKFEHSYDPSGRVALVSDQEGGQWQYSGGTDANGNQLSSVVTAEGNQTSQQFFSDSLGSTYMTTYPSGAQSTSFVSTEGLTESDSLPCGMEDSRTYDFDKIQSVKYLKDETKTAPSGLARTTAFARSYQDSDQDGIYDLITGTITFNGKSSTIFNHTLTGQRVITSPMGRTVTENYDPANLLLTSLSIPDLLDTSFGYDAKGRLTSVTTGTRQTGYTYSPQGFLATITDALGHTTTYTHDAVGRVTRINRADGSSVGFAYDANGNLTQLATPSAVVHGFGYNLVNKQISYQAPLSGTYRYIYDKDRRLVETDYPSGFQVKNIYNTTQLAQIQTPEGNIDYTYLCNAKIGTITNYAATLTYGYDGSMLTSEAVNGTLNQTLAFTYNNDFQIQSFSYAGATETFGYDNDGLLTDAGAFTIDRNAANGLPETVTDSTLNIARNFNGYGEVSGQSVAVNGNSVASWNLSRDDAGRIVAKTETVGGTTTNYTYGYDNLGRLTSVTKNGVQVETYQYGADGTRTTDTNTLRGITACSFSYSTEDHILSAGSATYQFDVDGFLLSKTNGSAVTTYLYSSRGELMQSKLPDGTVIEYLYDPLKRRIAKKVNGTVVEKYLWQGMTKLLAVYDGNDNLLMRFTYADGRMPVAMTKGGSTYYLAYDQVGSLRAVSDASGSIVKEITYDSFGNIISDSAPSFEVPFGFAGGLQDRNTGLVHFGLRDYDPDIGRWVAKDPILFAGGDTDLYGYCQSDPVNLVDPHGNLFGTAVVGAIAGAYSGFLSGMQSGHIGAAIAGGVAGGVAGALVGAILPEYSSMAGSMFGGLISGAIGGAVGGAETKNWSDKCASAGDIGKAALKGAAIGALTGTMEGGFTGAAEAAGIEAPTAINAAGHMITAPIDWGVSSIH